MTLAALGFSQKRISRTERIAAAGLYQSGADVPGATSPWLRPDGSRLSRPATPRNCPG
ncbi:MAG: hypothetical protein MZV64_01755 [Ignavibacteriales bacterium]|nr:hypothetical protein [Ignavibacteriales bacterium]